MMVATLTDPFGVGHMGVTAENLISGASRARSGRAVESARRGGGVAEGRFNADRADREADEEGLVIRHGRER
jgi:acetyl-CoA C-acetyltransferase